MPGAWCPGCDSPIYTFGREQLCSRCKRMTPNQRRKARKRKAELENLGGNVKQTTLYYREGSSDKCYQAAIEPKGEGFIVTFAFGRRGETLRPGTKTPKPVSQAEAEKIFNKLISDKMAKGYSAGEEGTPYVGGDKEARSTGIACQLLNAIDEDGPGGAAELLADDSYGGQEKYDGKRILVHAFYDQVSAINRKGLICGIPQTIEKAALSVSRQVGELFIDGEAIGDRLYTFDILQIGNRDVRMNPYVDRWATLKTLVDHPDLPVGDLAIGISAKAVLWSRLKQEKREGIVFKKLNAPYSGGRGAQTQFKHKFTATCTCEVAGINNKRSIILSMLGARSGPAVGVGNCSIPVNKAIPPVGALVEIRYLYAFRGGSLFQPFYLGERDDLDQADLVSSLKFKAVEEE